MIKRVCDWRFLMCIFVVCLCACSEKIEHKSRLNGPIFEKVLPNSSGIIFNNELIPNVASNQNLLDFDYFYNGAGVGVGDINNDGLPDIFFCGNQVDNQLYLNKGNLEFENISDVAGINANKYWANGVTFVDINNDGWLDIYVSQGGPEEQGNRGNLLYLNNGDLTFSEKAEVFGLNDEGISTQSAFFDFDKDGDMDCLVMNESVLYGYDPITFHRLLIEYPEETYVGYSHLYRNDGGLFKDVTRSSGITAPTFGLGLGVSDINSDGWLDIYISNDYYQPDNVYINKKNGTFTDRSKIHLSQMSFFGMGMDIADINNDGHQDIFVLDMASKDHVRSKTLMASMDIESFDLLVDQFDFPYQYMFNSLQLNNGRGVFHNVAQMTGVAKTDWSWSVLMEDFDNDGLRDIFVTNGYRKYGTDNDFKRKVDEAKEKFNNEIPSSEKEKLYASIPSEKLKNNFFRQNDYLNFGEVNSLAGLDEETYSNGAAYADLDQDGDLDLVVNNIDDVALLYENKASSGNYLNIKFTQDRAQFAEVKIEYQDKMQVGEVRRVRGYMSSVEPLVHFGLGEANLIDRLTIKFQDGKVMTREDVEVNQTLDINFYDSKSVEDKGEIKRSNKFHPLLPRAMGIDYTHVENEYNDFEDEVLLPYKQSTLGPCTAVADINKDGIDDFYIGGAAGSSGAVYVSENNTYNKIILDSDPLANRYEDADAVFLDLEGDGDQDLIVVSGGNEWPSTSSNYENRIYTQDESGLFNRKNMTSFSKGSHSTGIVKTIDFDNDGDADVLVGNRIEAQKYPIYAPSFLFENVNGQLEDVTDEKASGLTDAGIINDIEVKDIDGDGWMDFLVVGEWETPYLFINQEGRFIRNSIEKANTGMWLSITPTDIENDGDIDFILGNIGENYKLKPSIDSPIKIYASDLDSNGTHDLVLSTKYKGEYVPVRGKECSSEQLPFITDKFESYESFASSSLVQVYGDESLDKSYQKEMATTSSIILLNEGGFEFSFGKLPIEVQAFPLLDAAAVDLNNDDRMDIIPVGTLYDMEVETPRLDAGTGMVLLNESKSYKVDKDDYYLYISGDIRTIDLLNGVNNKKMLLITKNNTVPALFEIKKD